MTLTPGKVVLSNPLTCTNTAKGENKLYSDAKGVVPSLDLRFAEGKNLNDYMTGQNLITFSRSSIGTYVDENGIIQTATADTPRFDHDPTTGESLGLLIEESRTNLFDYSTDLTQWTARNSAAPLASSEIAPDGSTDAYRLNVNIGGTSYFYRNVATVAGNVYTISVWAKNVPGEQNFFDLFFNTAASVQLGKTALTDTWTRYHITGTATQTGNVFAGINNPPDDYTARGLFWGFQFELGAFPTSYIPTTGTALTRSADVASISGSNFSSWYNQSEGTVFASARLSDPVASQVNGYNKTIFSLNSNTSNFAALWISPTSLTVGFYVRSAGSLEAYVQPTSIAANTLQNIATAFKENNFNACVNGTIGSLDTLGSLPLNVSNLNIGTPFNGTSGLWSGHISRLTYFPERLPDSSLQTITTP